LFRILNLDSHWKFLNYAIHDLITGWLEGAVALAKLIDEWVVCLSPVVTFLLG
jgi:hypothetical protein